MFSALDARGAIVDARGARPLRRKRRARDRGTVPRRRAATFVERDRDAIGAIRTNLQTLGYEDRSHRSWSLDVARFVDGPPPLDAPFDLVFADPPYDTERRRRDRAPGRARRLRAGSRDDAIVAVERPVRHPVVAPDGCTNGWERTFGDTLLTFCWKSP